MSNWNWFAEGPAAAEKGSADESLTFSIDADEEEEEEKPCQMDFYVFIYIFMVDSLSTFN